MTEVASIISRVNNLPLEMIETIKEFIPLETLLWTNKKQYMKHHILIKKMVIKNHYDNYIRDMIRRDNYFVVELLMKENVQKWLFMKRYQYKNATYSNYIEFLRDYCLRNDSTKCRNILNILTISGLCKNEHKNNIVRNIRWTN